MTLNKQFNILGNNAYSFPFSAQLGVGGNQHNLSIA